MEAKQSAHINRPEKVSITGFVFICPGRFEEINEKPCAGQTGKNLQDGVSNLNLLKPSIFPYKDRYEYLITNAWDQVEYKATPRKRSVPTCVEVAGKKNIERLFLEIEHLEYVIACGERAHLAVNLCTEFFNLKGRVAFARHTSRQALGCPKGSMDKAISDWALAISSQF